MREMSPQMGGLCKRNTQAPHPSTCQALSVVLALLQGAELGCGDKEERLGRFAQTSEGDPRLPPILERRFS